MAQSSGLKRRKIKTGEKREAGELKYLDCKCGQSVPVDGRTSSVICAYCVQRMCGGPEKKTK